MPGSMLGDAVRRVEDPELVLGRGTHVGNLRVQGLLHLAFVRSVAAGARPGRAGQRNRGGRDAGRRCRVTAADLRLPAMHGFMVVNEACARPPLAEDKVRFVGECVAAIVAGTETAAVGARCDQELM